MRIRNLSRPLVLLAGVTMLAALTACGEAGEDAGGQPLKVAFLLREQGGTTYFQQVAEGARDEAGKLNVELSVQFTNSSDQQLSAVDTAIASGVKGLIVTIQDPAIGPAVATKAKNADIALLASPDSFNDTAGKAVPVVTLDAKKNGRDVGTEMGKQLQAAGWASDPAKKVAVASVELPKVATCNDRTDGAREAFAEAVPAFDKANIVKLDYDGTLNSANDTMAAGLNNHRDVTNWLVWSCNDEGVVGAVAALANAGIGADRVIGIGLGANLACDQWGKTQPTGYKAAIALDPKLNGRMAVQVMAEHLNGNGELPATTIFPGTAVNPETDRSTLPC